MPQDRTKVTPRAVQLTARVVENTVVVSGEGGADLPQNSGAHRFDFTLTGPPGLTVQFKSLDSQDDCSTCPPAAGDNSSQIVGVRIDGDRASFTDNNNNRDGPIDVAYQWNFSCSDPSLRVEPFDPIIKNGGTT